MTSRPLSFIARAAAALLLLAAVTPAAAAEPIRIGFLAPFSGLFAQAGKDMLEGMQLGLEEAGLQVAGRKIELIAEDDESNNATAVAKYRKLVEHDRVHVFAGVLLVNIGYGLAPMIDRDQLPSLFLTTPDDLTKGDRGDTVTRSRDSLPVWLT